MQSIKNETGFIDSEGRALSDCILRFRPKNLSQLNLYQRFCVFYERHIARVNYPKLAKLAIFKPPQLIGK